MQNGRFYLNEMRTTHWSNETNENKSNKKNYTNKPLQLFQH